MSGPLYHGPLALDPARHAAWCSGAPLSLTPTEFSLLHTLMLNAGQVLDRETLLAQALGYDYDGGGRVVDSHILHLRKKLAAAGAPANLIAGVRGIGYRLGVGTGPLPSAPPTREARTPAGNPFTDRGRINDPARFHGRRRLLRELRQDLAQFGNVSLVGEPSIGKSSLLAYLESTAPAWAAPGVAVRYVDLQGVLDEADFCESVLLALGVGGTDDSPPVDYDLRALKRALRARRAVLLLDELERIREPSFSPRLPDLLRSLAQQDHLAFVVATRTPLEHLFPDEAGRTSPFYNVFALKPLGPFEPEEAEGFVRARLEGSPVAFSAAELVDLLALSGCHPARLQTAAYCLFEARRAGSDEDWRARFRQLTGDPDG